MEPLDVFSPYARCLLMKFNAGDKDHRLPLILYHLSMLVYQLRFSFLFFFFSVVIRSISMLLL